MTKKFFKITVIGSGVLCLLLPIATNSIVPIINNTNYAEQKSDERSIQKEMFSSVDKNNIEDELDNILNSRSKNITYKIQNAENSLIDSDAMVLEKIRIEKEKNFKHDILDSIDKIINGDILIHDIEQKYLDSIIGDDKLLREYYSLRKISEQNDQLLELKVQNQMTDTLYNSSETENLTNNELNVLFKCDSIIKEYETFAWTMCSFATANTTLAAICWGISAYYWAAWWMFGANIPFAVSATAQSVSLTVSAALGWESFYYSMKDVEGLKSLSEHKKNSLLRNISDYAGEAARNAVISRSINSVTEVILKKITSNLVYKFPIFISSRMTSLYAISSVFLATSWATQLYHTIVAVAAVISVLNVFADIMKVLILSDI